MAAPRVKRRTSTKTRDLEVTGARLHNLKNIDVRIPAGAITVVTGPSGSGKTSLAFDTIFAEGQRRYVESLSTYARRFLGRMDKPPVDMITGLGPAIAIDQRNKSRNPRSTVATTTEIHDYLRLLFARAGTPRCPECKKALEARSPSVEARRLVRAHKGERLLVVAPVRDVEAKRLKREGYTRLYVAGKQVPLKDMDSAYLVVDRIVVKEKARVAEALQDAYRVGHGVAGVARPGEEPRLFCERPGCVEHGVMLPGDSLEPRMFSFNSHHGACGRCNGLGVIQKADPQKVIRHPNKTFRGGAFGGGAASYLSESKWYRAMIEVVAEVCGLPLKKPLGQWTEEQLRILFDGTGDEIYVIRKRMRRPGGKSYRMRSEQAWKGISAILQDWYRRSSGGRWTERISEVMRPELCPNCGGDRLGPLSRVVTIGRGTTLGKVSRMTVAAARAYFEAFKQDEIVAEVLREVRERLHFLDEVGLGYLTLDRGSATLSGGEAQRIRLATQIGVGLVGVVYVLDEPTMGLHPRDTHRLLESLRGLRDLGNTVLLVEHDTDTIRAADHVIDLGPGAGKCGGEVIFSGTVPQLMKQRGLPTADFVSGRRRIERPPQRKPPKEFLKVSDARANNLKKLKAKIPVGRLSCITGVSGAGKSSLLFDVLWAAADAEEGDTTVPGKVTGLDRFGTIYVVDQHPIGMTPASNPATYTKAFDPIRKLFAQLPESRVRGYDAGRFSFNRAGGRCEACDGRGAVKVEMHFLADVWVPCEECKSKRYNRETLEVKYKGKTIADVLAMEISEARELFANIPQIERILSTLDDVGLGYLGLGQPATTLSGGEAQRVKLASELARRTRSEVLYLLDEPTCGLHPTDIERLVQVLHRLVDNGHTVVVVEHNVEFIRTADWIVDLGPEGGDGGGRLVAQGPLEAIVKAKGSHTGKVL